MAIDKDALRAQIADLIADDCETVTFRGVAVTVRRTEAFHQREMLAAGFRDSADHEFYLATENVAGAGDPTADEDITDAAGNVYAITGVRRSAAGAFWTLNVKRVQR